MDSLPPGLFAQALTLATALWKAVAALDGRTAFVSGFLTCALIWRIARAVSGMALRGALMAAVAAGGLGSVGWMGGREQTKTFPPATAAQAQQNLDAVVNALGPR